MEEKTSTRRSLFTVTESPYLTLLKPFLPTLLNQAKSVVESFLQNVLQPLLLFGGDVEKTTSAFLKVRRLGTVLPFFL